MWIPELQASYFWGFQITNEELVLSKQDSGPVLDPYL